MALIQKDLPNKINEFISMLDKVPQIKEPASVIINTPLDQMHAVIEALLLLVSIQDHIALLKLKGSDSDRVMGEQFENIMISVLE